MGWIWHWNSSRKKRGTYISGFLTDDDRRLSVSRDFSKRFKENFPKHKRKHNVSLNLWHEVNTKNIEYFMVDNKQEPWYDSKPSVDGKKQHFNYQYLNSMTIFILSLVIYFVGSWFKLLRMSWYKCMKPFRDNLQLAINKYLCPFHDSFPGIEYKSNE